MRIASPRETLPDGHERAHAYDPPATRRRLTPPGRGPHVFVHTPRDLIERYTPPALAGVDRCRRSYTYDAGRCPASAARARTRPLVELWTTTSPDGWTASPNRVGSRVSRSRANRHARSPPRRREANGSRTTTTGALPSRWTYNGTVAATVVRVYDSMQRVGQASGERRDATAFTYDADGLHSGVGALTVTRDTADGLVTAVSMGLQQRHRRRRATDMASPNNHHPAGWRGAHLSKLCPRQSRSNHDEDRNAWWRHKHPRVLL